MEAKREISDRRTRPRLYRSQDDVVIGGVIGGVGKYLLIDSTFLRLIGVFLFLLTGVIPGLVAYILALIFIPKDGERRTGSI